MKGAVFQRYADVDAKCEQAFDNVFFLQTNTAAVALPKRIVGVSSIYQRSECLQI